MDNYDIIEKEAVKDAKRRVDAAGEKLSPFLAELVKACGVGKPANSPGEPAKWVLFIPRVLRYSA